MHREVIRACSDYKEAAMKSCTIFCASCLHWLHVPVVLSCDGVLKGHHGPTINYTAYSSIVSWHDYASFCDEKPLLIESDSLPAAGVKPGRRPSRISRRCFRSA